MSGAYAAHAHRLREDGVGFCRCSRSQTAVSDARGDRRPAMTAEPVPGASRSSRQISRLKIGDESQRPRRDDGCGSSAPDITAISPKQSPGPSVLIDRTVVNHVGRARTGSRTPRGRSRSSRRRTRHRRRSRAPRTPSRCVPAARPTTRRTVAAPPDPPRPSRRRHHCHGGDLVSEWWRSGERKERRTRREPGNASRYPGPCQATAMEVRRSVLRLGEGRRLKRLAEQAGLHRDARARLRDALGRRAPREDRRVQAAHRERRVARRDPIFEAFAAVREARRRTSRGSGCSTSS